MNHGRRVGVDERRGSETQGLRLGEGKTAGIRQIKLDDAAKRHLGLRRRVNENGDRGGS